MSKKKLREVLSERLKLTNAQFFLEKVGAKLSGSIVSDRFRGRRDRERQQMIWDALDEEFGPESIQLVGTLLAYTPDEWNMDLTADVSKPGKAKAV